MLEGNADQNAGPRIPGHVGWHGGWHGGWHSAESHAMPLRYLARTQTRQRACPFGRAPLPVSDPRIGHRTLATEATEAG